MDYFCRDVTPIHLEYYASVVARIDLIETFFAVIREPTAA